MAWGGKVKNNLRFAKGVKEIEQVLKVYVTYDAQKTNEEKASKAFEKFGYRQKRLTKS